MLLRTTLAAIALVAFAASQPPVQNAELDTTTIVHVTVVDVSTGKELPDQTVVLDGDHIVSVAAFDPTAPAPQGRVVDAQGAFLIPGLWDMHVHIQDLEDLPLYVANGVTGVRLMFGSKKTKESRARFASVRSRPIFSSAAPSWTAIPPPGRAQSSFISPATHAG